MPAIRSLLRRIFPSCFGSSAHADSQGPSYRLSSVTPMQSQDAKRSAGLSVTVTTHRSTGDSDIVELVDKADNKNGKNYDWA